MKKKGNDIMFYNFHQNNSGGTHITNMNLCAELYIEADSIHEAIAKAESLGCYWDGVAKGIDCPCCGDRWSCGYLRPINLEKYKTEGYKAHVYDDIYTDTKAEWEKRYRKYKVIKEPEYVKTFTSRAYEGKVAFDTIEDYVQFFVNEYGRWTTPDARIFYKDGTVGEFFNQEKEKWG